MTEQTTSATTIDAAVATVEELVEANLVLVHHVVNQLSARYPRHVDRDELWSAGAAGLVDAATRFDPTAGVPFARYAAIRIRGAIIDSTRSRDWATRSLRRRARTVKVAEEQLVQLLGHAPTDVEIAEACEIEPAEVARIRAAEERAQLLALDQPTSTQDGGVSLADTLVGAEDQPEQVLVDGEPLRMLRTAVEHLEGPLRTVLVGHFFDGRLMQDIAAELGVTEARVSQIASEAITSLRAFMGTQFDGVPAVAAGTPGARRRDTFLQEMAGVSWSQLVAA